MEKSKKGLGVVYLLIAIVFFSTFEVMNKIIFETNGVEIGPQQINFLRFFFGGLLLILILIFKRDFKISFKNLLLCGLLGVLVVTISMAFIQFALVAKDSKASIVAVIFSSNPVFVFTICALMGKEKLTAKKGIGIIIGFIGVIVVFLEQLDVTALLKTSSLFALVSAISYALYTVFGRELMKEVGSLKMNAYSFTLGSISLIPVLLIRGEPLFVVHASIIPHIGYLVVFVTCIAYVAYFQGLGILGAGMGSLTFFLKPVLASIIAIIVLKDPLTINLVVGTMLILSGIALATINIKS